MFNSFSHSLLSNGEDRHLADMSQNNVYSPLIIRAPIEKIRYTTVSEPGYSLRLMGKVLQAVAPRAINMKGFVR